MEGAGSLVAAEPSRFDPTTIPEPPFFTTEELEGFARSGHKAVARWASRALLHLDPAGIASRLDRLAGSAPEEAIEPLLLALIGRRECLPRRAGSILLQDTGPLHDLAVIGTLLCGPEPDPAVLAASGSGRLALWLRDLPRGGSPDRLHGAATTLSPAAETALLEAAREWLAESRVTHLLDGILQAGKTDSPAPAALLLALLTERLGVPEFYPTLSTWLLWTRRPGDAAPLRVLLSPPRFPRAPRIQQTVTDLIDASPSRAAKLAPEAIRLLHSHPIAHPPSGPDWFGALANSAERTWSDAEDVLKALHHPGRLGPYAGITGPLMGIALLAGFRESDRVGSFTGCDDTQAFFRAITSATSPCVNPAPLARKAADLEPEQFAEGVLSARRGSGASGLSLPLEILERRPEWDRTKVLIRWLQAIEGTPGAAEQIFDALRPLGWASLPPVVRVLPSLEPGARRAGFEYLRAFPGPTALGVLLKLFDHEIASDHPDRFVEAVAAMGCEEAADRLIREWRPGELTIGRAIGFLAEIIPDLKPRCRKILDDTARLEGILSGERPPLLLPVRCTRCGRMSEHVVEQVLLTGDELSSALPTRLILCKYCGAVECWRYTPRAMEQFDEALAREMETIARTGASIPLERARFVDARRLGHPSAGLPPTPREEYRRARKKLSRNREDPEALYTIGRLLRRGGWTRQATPPLTRLVRKHPDHLPGRVEYAWLQLDRHRLDLAAVEYERSRAMLGSSSGLCRQTRTALQNDLDRLAGELVRRGASLHPLPEEAPGKPKPGDTACFGGFEPAGGITTAQSEAVPWEEKAPRERPCPCGSGTPFARCCGAISWIPFVS